MQCRLVVEILAAKSIAAGKITMTTETRRLEQVNEAFAEIETRKAKARLVFDLR